MLAGNPAPSIRWFVPQGKYCRTASGGSAVCRIEWRSAWSPDKDRSCLLQQFPALSSTDVGRTAADIRPDPHGNGIPAAAWSGRWHTGFFHSWIPVPVSSRSCDDRTFFCSFLFLLYLFIFVKGVYQNDARQTLLFPFLFFIQQYFSFIILYSNISDGSFMLINFRQIKNSTNRKFYNKKYINKNKNILEFCRCWKLHFRMIRNGTGCNSGKTCYIK